MRKIILLFYILCTSILVKSQSIFDDFENANCSGNTGSNIFVNTISHSANTAGCLPNWNSTHGSPNTFGPNDNVTSNPSNFNDLKSRLTGNCLNMFWTSSLKSEGAFRTFSFISNTCYKIKLKVCATLNGETSPNLSTQRFLRIFAAKDLPTNGCCVSESTRPSVPTSNLVSIGQKEFLTTSLSSQVFTQWETIEFNFITQRSDLNCIWLFPELAGGGSLIVAIDDFSIEEACQSDIFLTNTTTPYSGIIKASNTITVRSLSGLVSSSSSVSTLLQAGNFVLFDVGSFVPKPQPSTFFLAKIGTCPPATQCPGQSFINENGTAAGEMKDNNMDLDNTLYIYPNPNTGDFQIYLREPNNLKNSKLEVTDIFGKLILIDTFEGSGQHINLGKQKTGIYFLKIYSKSQVFTYKFIIQ